MLSAGATVTTNGSASMAATGFTPAFSSSYYVTLYTSAGSVKGTASVGTEGYVKNETATGSDTSVSVIGNGDRLYIPTTSRSASAGFVELTSEAGSVSSTGTNITLTESSYEPSGGYYITSTGSGTVSGIGYGEVSTGTGFITSGTTSSNTSYLAIQSSNTATKYYTIDTESKTITSNGTYYPSTGTLLESVTVNVDDPHSSYTPSSIFFTTTDTGLGSITENSYSTSTYYIKAGELSNVTTSSTGVPLVTTSG